MYKLDSVKKLNYYIANGTVSEDGPAEDGPAYTGLKSVLSAVTVNSQAAMRNHQLWGLITKEDNPFLSLIGSHHHYSRDFRESRGIESFKQRSTAFANSINTVPEVQEFLSGNDVPDPRTGMSGAIFQPESLLEFWCERLTLREDRSKELSRALGNAVKKGFACAADHFAIETVIRGSNAYKAWKDVLPDSEFDAQEIVQQALCECKSDLNEIETNRQNLNLWVQELKDHFKSLVEASGDTQFPSSTEIILQTAGFGLKYYQLVEKVDMGYGVERNKLGGTAHILAEFHAYASRFLERDRGSKDVPTKVETEQLLRTQFGLYQTRVAASEKIAKSEPTFGRLWRATELMSRVGALIAGNDLATDDIDPLGVLEAAWELFTSIRSKRDTAPITGGEEPVRTCKASALDGHDDKCICNANGLERFESMVRIWIARRDALYAHFKAEGTDCRRGCTTPAVHKAVLQYLAAPFSELEPVYNACRHGGQYVYVSYPYMWSLLSKIPQAFATSTNQQGTNEDKVLQALLKRIVGSEPKLLKLAVVAEQCFAQHRAVGAGIRGLIVKAVNEQIASVRESGVQGLCSYSSKPSYLNSNLSWQLQDKLKKLCKIADGVYLEMPNIDSYLTDELSAEKLRLSVDSFISKAEKIKKDKLAAIREETRAREKCAKLLADHGITDEELNAAASNMCRMRHYRIESQAANVVDYKDAYIQLRRYHHNQATKEHDKNWDAFEKACVYEIRRRRLHQILALSPSWAELQSAVQLQIRADCELYQTYRYADHKTALAVTPVDVAKELVRVAKKYATASASTLKAVLRAKVYPSVRPLPHSARPHALFRRLHAGDVKHSSRAISYRCTIFCWEGRSRQEKGWPQPQNILFAAEV